MLLAPAGDGGGHGPHGKGQTAMGVKLGARDLTGLKGDEATARAIEDGKPPKMPVFKSRLSAEQIKALASYVKGGLRKP